MVSSLAPISCSTYNFFSYSYFTYNLKEETLDSFLKSRYKKRENIFSQTFICSRSFCRNQIIGSSLIGKCGTSLVELEAFRVLTVPHPFTNLFFFPPFGSLILVSFWSHNFVYVTKSLLGSDRWTVICILQANDIYLVCHSTQK